MFSKNNKLWLRNIAALAAVSIVLAVSPAIAVVWTDCTQATLGDMSSVTDLPNYDSEPASRTKIGLLERVMCAIATNTWEDSDRTDGSHTIDYIGPWVDRKWTKIGTGGTITPTTGNYTYLTADDDPGSVTVKVTVPDSGDRFVDDPVEKTIDFNVVAPDGEDTEVIEWNTEVTTCLNFGARLTPTVVSFGEISVEEIDGEGSLDECWYWGLDESFKQESVTDGIWVVDQWNYWDCDMIGWAPSYITFYRNNPETPPPSAPCQTTVMQEMWVVEGDSCDYTENALVAEIGTTTITNYRDGEYDSKTYP